MSHFGLSLASIIVALILATPSASNERPDFGIDRLEIGRGGSEAALCGWLVVLSVQAATKSCNLQRTPTDAAIDEAVLAIDEFIVANASARPTHVELAEIKGRITSAMTPLPQRFCEKSLEFWRGRSPDTIRSWVKTLMATPDKAIAAPAHCL